MIAEVLGSLADELTPGGPGGTPGRLRLRQGEIVSVQADGTATITIGGDTTALAGIKVASNVCPIPGASCWLAVDGGDLFILATLAPSGAAFGRMRQSSAQTVTSGGYARMSFTNRTAVRTQGVTVGNNGFTVVVPGWYQVNAQVSWATAAATRRGIQILGGGSRYSGGNLVQVTSSGQPSISASAIVEAAAGELIEAEIFQDSGGNLATVVGGGLCVLDVTWLRPVDV